MLFQTTIDTPGLWPGLILYKANPIKTGVEWIDRECYFSSREVRLRRSLFAVFVDDALVQRLEPYRRPSRRYAYRYRVRRILEASLPIGLEESPLIWYLVLQLEGHGAPLLGHSAPLLGHDASCPYQHHLTQLVLDEPGELIQWRWIGEAHPQPRALERLLFPQMEVKLMQ